MDQTNAMGNVQIVRSTSSDSYLKVVLDTVSRSAYKDNPSSSLVLLGFTVTNLSSQPVWLYHVHGNAFGEYYDGSGVVGGSFAGQPFQAQLVRSEDMAESDQSTGADGELCISYGVNPGQTVEVSANGTMSSGAGTLTLSFNPPEQHGASAAAHNTTHTFEVTFPEACSPGDMQMAYV